MKAEKKVIGELTKCYSLTQIHMDGKDYVACAAEKEDPCYLYDLEGNFVEKLWDGPGGVMTMVQYPCADKTVLMATWKFYSPNNGGDAKIVYYVRENGTWNMHVLCALPFVHRFGVLERNGVRYLIACTLKSAHAFKNDWTCPGRIWVAELPEDLTVFDEEHPLELTALVSGLYRNHGFCKTVVDGVETALVGTDNGIYKVVPPEEKGGEWKADLLLETPASDMLYEDFDGDGRRELLVLSPFHGDTLSVYHLGENGYEKVWEAHEKMPFLHAIYACTFNGKMYGIIGNRENQKELIAVSYDNGGYVEEVLDEGAGPANVMYFRNGDEDKLIAANRETNEIAMYTLH